MKAQNWARVNAGKPLRILDKGYWYEGGFIWNYWSFAGGYDGHLVAYYRGTEWEADGWDGRLKYTTIETFMDQEPDSPPEIEPTTTWLIDCDLSEPETGAFRLRRLLYGGGALLRFAFEARAGTLNELREFLPHGLTRWAPEDPTNTSIVESWRRSYLRRSVAATNHCPHRYGLL